MKKNRINKKIVSLVLCSAMMLQLANISVQTNSSSFSNSYDSINNSSLSISGNSATDNDAALSEQDLPQTTVDSKKEQINIVNEVTDKWEANVRTYKNDDGSYVAASYTEPVNFLKDGQWTAIDNTLVLATDKDLGDVYQNTSNSFKATFPKISDSNSIVTMEKDKYSISWTLDPIKNPGKLNSEAEVSNYIAQDSGLTDNDKLMDAGKTRSTILYESVFTDIDLRYTVAPEKIKEDIILNKPNPMKSFVFNLKAPGLKTKISDDNSISFFNPDKPDVTVFSIPAPFMMDSSEEQTVSYDVAMELSETDNGYELTITPDCDWVNAPERVFPIFIDPTAYSSIVQTDIIDTYVHIGDTAGENRMSTTLVVGNKTLTNEIKCRSLIQTKIPDLPGVIVSDARLNLSVTSGSSTFQNLNVYRINTAWSSSTMYWGLAESIIDTTPIQTNLQVTSYSNSPSDYRYSCNVTSTVQNIYAGISTNYGFLVRYTNDTYPDYNRFYSSDYTTTTVRPQLVVTYTYTPNAEITNNGIYYIENKNSGKYLDVEGGDTTDGTDAIQWTYTGAINQQWKVIYQNDGTYKLQAMNTPNKYLEVETNNNNDGTPIDIFSGDWTEQYWYIMSNPNSSSFRILSKCSDYTKGAIVTGASTADGTNICQYTYTSGGNDEDDWYFYKAEDVVSLNDTYFLKNVSSNLYADVYSNELDDGAQIKQYSETDRSNQIWRIERQENGYYKIYPMHTNDRVMSLNTSNNIVSIANATNDRTLWTLEKVSGNTFKIYSKQDTSKYITVANNSLTTNLTGSTYNSTKSQWIIEEYDNNSKWGGECISSDKELTNAYFTATTAALNSNMTDAIYDDGEFWNVISSAVNLKYVSPGTSENGKDLMTTFRVSPYSGDEVSCAITLPIIGGVQRTFYTYTYDDLVSSDWDGSSIYIYMPAMVGISDDRRKEVVVHELGHALKLSHNRESEDSDNDSWQPAYKATFPSIMHTICDTISGTTYEQAEQHMASWTLTNFDKSALRSKWGN